MSSQSEPLFVEERKIMIVEHIEAHKKVTVAELCELFRVSSATIRSDLRDLDKAGLIIRSHGGAMVKSKTGLEIDMNERRVQNSEAKRAIAEEAIGLVEDGDTLVVDTGTTACEFARLLLRKKNLTVVTNDLLIALMLEEAESSRIVLLGGTMRKSFHCTIASGPHRNELLSELAVDKAFMATNGFSLEKGASTPDLQQAETKKLLMSIAARVIVLFDSSKWGRNSFGVFAPLERIDTIVTDSLGEEERRKLEENEIEVIIAGSSNREGHPQRERGEER